MGYIVTLIPALPMDVFHEGMNITACPAVVTQLAAGAYTRPLFGTTYVLYAG